MTEQDWKAAINSSENIFTPGQIIIWSSNDHRAYHDARVAGSTYPTPSSMDMLSDLESSASGFLDFMEIKDSMDDFGAGQDCAFGVLYHIDNDKRIYVEVDIIRSYIESSERRSCKDIVLHAIDVLYHPENHLDKLPNGAQKEQIQSFINVFID